MSQAIKIMSEAMSEMAERIVELEADLEESRKKEQDWFNAYLHERDKHNNEPAEMGPEYDPFAGKE